MRSRLIFATLMFFVGAATAGTIEAYFSPGGGAQAAIVQHIARAKREIVVAAYSFTDPAIGAALVTALKRGVSVEVVIDKDHNRRGEKKSEETSSVADLLASSGAKIFIAPKGVSIQHNKFIVVDATHVETGSYNYSAAAEKSNAENILILSDVPNLAAQYKLKWSWLKERASVYTARY